MDILDMQAQGLFSRSETSKLTGLELHQLSYLDNRAKLVQPTKIGKIVLYSWPQILQLKTIARLRDKVSLQAIQQAVRYLSEHKINFQDAHQCLVAWNDNVLFFNVDQSQLIAEQVSGQHPGQIVVSVNLDELMQEAIEAGQENIQNFEARIADFMPQAVA